MSIDYSANFGVGYKVALPSSTEDPDAFIENALNSVGKTHKIGWFDTGDNTYFVSFSEPFNDDLDDMDDMEAVVRRASALKEILQGCGLEVVGEPEIVGGIRVCPLFGVSFGF